MNDRIKIIALGGQDEYDNKMTLVEVNDDIFVLGCGKKDPDKTRPGIKYVIANYQYLMDNKARVKGYIITHAFDSLLGGLIYVYKDVPAPIYCSDVTRIFISSFAEHNRVKIDFNFFIVKPTDSITVSGHKIRFFQCASNMSHSSGVAINTSYGNIVYADSFVIDHNSDPDFYYDSKALGELANEPTLVLMCESRYSDYPGYTNPKYKLVPLVERSFHDAQGRIFIAMAVPDAYNIVKIIGLALRNKRKIITYDEETFQTIMRVIDSHEVGKKINKSSFLPFGEINRISSKDCLVLMLGWGERLYHKIELLADASKFDKRISLNETDTFIIGTCYSSSTEIVANEALDELYKTDAKIISFKKNEFIRMHASVEDLKTIISFLRPKYYVPIYGTYRELLNNAKLSLEMGLDLTYASIFILDNGNILEINEGKAKISPNSVITGHLYVDGSGVGDISSSTLTERQKFSDDGVLIMGVMINKGKTDIISTFDVQMRGLVYLKDNDNLVKELTRLFEVLVQKGLDEQKPLNLIEEEVKDASFRTIRRYTGKSPLIVPYIAVANN